MLLESGESALLIFLPDEPLCIRRTSEGGAGKMLHRADVGMCMCVSLCESKAGFSLLASEGAYTSWVATDVDVCACVLL